MTKKLQVVVGILAALALVAACSKKEEVLISRNCTADIASGYCDAGGTKCTVTVAIDECGAAPKVTPDSLHVCKPRTKITWKLVATGSAKDAKFASNGIDFKSTEFEKPRPDNQEFEWTDIRSKADPEHPVKYDIHILKKDSSDCKHYDPFVVNE